MSGDPIFRAMLLGAIAAGVIGAIASFALASAVGGAAATLFALPFWLFVTLAPTLSIAVTLGVAWHRFAQRRGWRALSIYAAPGAFVGAVIPAGVYALIWGGQAGVGFLLPLAVCGYGAIVGAMTGAFAWLIRRPDRDSDGDRDRANPPTAGA